ncbi:MAG TPA: MaoC family dehydratase [Alphaproteobacteria bacterium]
MRPRHDLYLDDFQVGDRFESPAGYTFTDADIIGFAARYDPQPFHVDAEAAKGSLYGSLIASGFHTLAVAFRLFYQTGALTSANMGGPGLDELRWLKPVRVGDTIRVTAEILEVKPSTSKPDRGILRYRLTCTNQNGETVMTVVITSLVKRRPRT